MRPVNDMLSGISAVGWWGPCYLRIIMGFTFGYIMALYLLLVQVAMSV
jgi:hypothetical protein